MDATIKFLPAISSVVDRYEAFLVDAWGVLHDGSRTYPGAVDCLQRLRAANKKVIVLSNAGRRSAVVAAEMAKLGLDAHAYDAVVCSGEETWQALKHKRDPEFKRLGPACYFMGPARSRGLLDGLEFNLVTSIGEADFALNSGVEGDLPDATGFEELLREALAGGLTMVCANPDLVAIRAGRRGICAGAIAARYEELGGVVLYRGKPHPEIYTSCFALLDGISRGRIVAIGDALRTDIAGATVSGIDSILVTGGIHARELKDPDADRGIGFNWQRLEQVCTDEAVRPTYVTGRFTWR